MHTNIINQLRTLGIEFDQNRLKRSNFLRFWIFWKFSINCVTCANLELLSLKFMYECPNTEWCFIRNSVRIGRGLYFLDSFQFFNFFYWDIKYWNFDVSMKLPLWGSQNQATYFFKEITLWNQWGSNMGFPIHMLFK